MARRLTGITFLLLTTLATQAGADDWKSGEAASALVKQMDSAKADAVATRDPDRPERFVAALRLPGQLLVVSATHPSIDLVAQRLADHAFRDVYMDLQGTPARASKFFVLDIEGDGLSVGSTGNASDMVYDGSTVLTCDGRWKEANVSKEAYRDLVEKADARYARLIGLLADALSPDQ